MKPDAPADVPLTASAGPPSIDLRSRFPPLRNQDGLHTCIALAAADLIWWELRRSVETELVEPSALFIHYNAKRLAGHERWNVPVRPSHVIEAVREFGVCPEELWPYRPARHAVEPPASAYAAAEALGPWTFPESSSDLETLRAHLAGGRPFLFCVRLFPSNCWRFERGDGVSTGRLTPPHPSEEPVRNHALLAVGYDDDAAALLARNTFGPGWGDQGHAWVPYEYLVEPTLAYAVKTARSKRSDTARTPTPSI